MSLRQGMVGLLVALIFCSAMGVVYSKHVSRSLFVESRALQAEIDELNIDWGRLQLEQSTWATHGRVEQLASGKLGMYVPDFNQRVMVPK
ncbi:MAG: cell division protein FtsL [Pseudomonadota bacterium]